MEEEEEEEEGDEFREIWNIIKDNNNNNNTQLRLAQIFFDYPLTFATVTMLETFFVADPLSAECHSINTLVESIGYKVKIGKNAAVLSVLRFSEEEVS